MFRYFVIYKPYKIFSQFSAAENKKTLADFFKVPRNVYPVGRLDEDSEGLLLLTNDKQLNHRLLSPSFAHEREYWVQVEGNATNEKVSVLENGIEINVSGSAYVTLPCKAEVMNVPPEIPDRVPPIRQRTLIPVSWIKLILKEGKNRQVRKMTAKIGLPTLRLVRYRIADIVLGAMQPGTMVELPGKTVYRKIFGAAD